VIDEQADQPAHQSQEGDEAAQNHCELHHVAVVYDHIDLLRL
jgi:hypothetical protein